MLAINRGQQLLDGHEEAAPTDISLASLPVGAASCRDLTIRLTSQIWATARALLTSTGHCHPLTSIIGDCEKCRPDPKDTDRLWLVGV